MKHTIETLPLHQIAPADYNPRADLQPGDAEYDKLRSSIEEFGLVEPLIWNRRSGTLISGHQRLKVLHELGHTEAECVVVDLDPDRERALNLAMNKIGGAWDNDKLRELLDSFSEDFDAKLSGFDMDEIAQLLAADIQSEDDGFDEQAALDEIAEPVTKPGDLWQLGEHLLLCGDATSAADMARLMDGELAQLIVTDPPYNVAYEGTQSKQREAIANDNMPSEKFREFLLAAFSAAHEAAAPGAACYVFHAHVESVNFMRAFTAAGFTLRQVLVWVKNQIVLGRQDYQWKHEPVLYGWKPGTAHYFVDDRTQSTVLECDKPVSSPDHPTTKPVELVGRLVSNSSNPGWLVLDPFAGSGTTLIACERLQRRARCMELDPKYCDVIVRRWEAATGQQAQRKPL